MGNCTNIQTSLHKAVVNGDCSQADFLLRTGAVANSPVMLKRKHSKIAKDAMEKDDGDTVLHVATRLGDLEMVRTLVNHSAKVNLRNWGKFTPLHVAAAVGRVDVVELLINHGANVNIYGGSANVKIYRGSGILPLHTAIKYGHADVTTFLLDRIGSNRQLVFAEDRISASSPLDTAVTFGHLNVVKILLHRYARLGTLSENDQLINDVSKRIVIRNAMQSRQQDVVDALLKTGANLLDAFNGAGNHVFFDMRQCCQRKGRPVMQDQQKLQTQIIQFINDILTEGLFNVNNLNSKAETPLHQTFQSCHGCNIPASKCETEHVGDTIARRLLEHGVNVNQSNCNGETALMHAVVCGCDHFVRILLEWTKDKNRNLLLDVRDELGETALLKAARHGYVHLVKLLIENGASVNVHDNRGFTALHTANYYEFNWFRSDYMYLLNEIQERKLEVDRNIMEPLEHRFGNTVYGPDVITDSTLKQEIVICILESGAAVETSVDFFGNTPGELSELISETLNSTNDSRRIRTFIVDAWERSPFHRLLMAFCYSSILGDEIITKEIKLGRLEETPSVLQPMTGQPRNPASIRDLRGRTALHYAAMAFGEIIPERYYQLRLSIIKLLLKIGANINEVDKYGKTALHYAHWDEFYSWLVEHGANEQVLDNKGHTPKCMLELCNTMDEFDDFDSQKIFNYTKSIDSTKIWLLHTSLIERRRRITRLDTVTKALESFVERIASAISEKDYRFACKSKLVGSASDGTKTDIPGDFDFDLTLTELSKRCEVHPSPVAPRGFVLLKRKGYDSVHILYRREDDFDAFFNFEQQLLVREVNYRFKILLEEVLHDPKFWSNDETFELFHLKTSDRLLKTLHRYIQLRMIDPLKDEDGDLYFEKLNLDIVPSVHLDNWWPDEALDSVKDIVKSFGCNLAFDSALRSCPWAPFAETYARISFAPAENYIMKNSSNLLKAAYFIAKVLRSDRLYFAESQLKNGAYVLKSSFLYCIEAFSTPGIEHESSELSINSASKLCFLVERILFCFAQFWDLDFLPCYFMPSFSIPIDSHLKSNHMQSILTGGIRERYDSEARDIYLRLSLGDTGTDLKTNSNTSFPSFVERDFINSDIQPLQECFDREAFMSKLRNCESFDSIVTHC